MCGDEACGMGGDGAFHVPNPPERAHARSAPAEVFDGERAVAGAHSVGHGGERGVVAAGDEVRGGGEALSFQPCRHALRRAVRVTHGERQSVVDGRPQHRNARSGKKSQMRSTIYGQDKAHYVQYQGAGAMSGTCSEATGATYFQVYTWYLVWSFFVVCLRTKNTLDPRLI